MFNTEPRFIVYDTPIHTNMNLKQYNHEQMSQADYSEDTALIRLPPSVNVKIF